MEYPESTILAAQKKGYKDVDKFVASRKRYAEKRKNNVEYNQRQSDYKRNKRKESDPWYKPNDAWAKSLKRLYGIDQSEYERMFEEQRGLCKICGNSETSRYKGVIKRLAVDHCHSSGRVRGLLCSHCNRGLGLFKDTPDFLFKAIKYLEEN